MKCPGCGSNLTIDDANCSFCGQANPFAQKHRSEMEKFTTEFNRTKSRVMKESKKMNYWAAKITLIAIMVAINIVIMFLYTNSYSVERFFVKRSIEANYQIHKNKVEELERNREYIALYQYFTEYRLLVSDLMNEYRQVETISSYYSTIYQYVLELKIKEPEEYSREDNLRYISEYMDSVYRYYKPSEYSEEECYTQEHQAFMIDAVAQLEDIIQTYCNLTDEEIESFETLSSARRQILMEEGLLRNE